MRTKLLVLISAGLAILLGCVETTGVQAPTAVSPNTSFTVIIDVMSSDSNWYPAIVGLAVLIPEIWEVDSLYGYGFGYSGTLDTLDYHFDPPWQHPAPGGYIWSCWQTPVAVVGDSGETGYAEAYISVSDSLGLFQLAFCAGYLNTIGPDFWWEEDPCSCVVEIVPLNLEQETWGHIKSEF